VDIAASSRSGTTAGWQLFRVLPLMDLGEQREAEKNRLPADVLEHSPRNDQ
jgi:hypothetical protein